MLLNKSPNDTNADNYIIRYGGIRGYQKLHEKTTAKNKRSERTIEKEDLRDKTMIV